MLFVYVFDEKTTKCQVVAECRISYISLVEKANRANCRRAKLMKVRTVLVLNQADKTRKDTRMRHIISSSNKTDHGLN